MRSVTSLLISTTDYIKIISKTRHLNAGQVLRNMTVFINIIHIVPLRCHIGHVHFKIP